MKLIKTGLVLLVTAASTIAMAGPYNHIDHNDPSRTIATNVIDTLNCGSLPLADCITPVNITNWGQQACKDKVLDMSDGVAIGFYDPYYHTINSYAERIISVVDNNNGSGAFAYTVNIQHSCHGFIHLPPRSNDYKTE